MQCPKCRAEQSDHADICTACGLVFAKYYKHHPPAGEAPVRPARRGRRRAAGRVRELLLGAPPLGGAPVLALRVLLWCVLLLWGLRLMAAPVSSNAAGESLLHLVNLPFHEAGHVIFAPLGDFIGSLGGTLGQLLMPLICLLVLLLRTRDPFGASVCLWWFGENFLDIAPYVADARAGVLPLLGGNTGQTAPYGFHDWEYLLTETGLLHLDRALGQTSHLLGALLMLTALVWAALLLLRQWRVLDRG
ncbi:hypothetical protein [Marichromatium gracile]|uniref:Zinc ribbon protein n=1 Tax=Marichromatium gracile TaxID=1048 RepID=A0ABR5VKG2_MARGR|nr:hypothetical protein [Marichromatium gracile]KXX65791.1 hypothetical protein AY586_08465 [Marichromatium gracile]